MPKPVSFGIIGRGWRAGCYARIAHMLPGQFHVMGIAARTADLAPSFGRIPVYHKLAELLSAKPDFVVLAVSKEAAAPYLLELAKQNIPVLAETPPAPSLNQLAELYRSLPPGTASQIQAAEHYALQPHHAARLQAICNGLIGAVHEASLSVAHGYHAIHLFRRYLAISRIEEAAVRMQGHRSIQPVVKGPHRGQLPEIRQLIHASRDSAILEFPSGQTGWYDFTREQYFSPIRKSRLLIRGEQGELENNKLRYINNQFQLIQLRLDRCVSGGESSLDPVSLQHLSLGQEVLYSNPFAGIPFSDEEIGVAVRLQRMNDYMQGAESYYSLHDACVDTYLAYSMEEAIAANGSLTVMPFEDWIRSRLPSSS